MDKGLISDQPGLCRFAYQHDGIVGVELVEQFLSIPLDGFGAERQTRRNLPRGKTFCYQTKNGQFSVVEFRNGYQCVIFHSVTNFVFPISKSTTPKGGNEILSHPITPIFTIFATMKRLFLILTLLLTGTAAGAYNDHRGHNLDSLETVVAAWTPERMAKATDEELQQLNSACRNLMLGYSQLNSVKCEFYARQALKISLPKSWEYANSDAFRYIGQCFYWKEQYDSALFYYNLSLDAIAKMDAGATSVSNPDGYDERMKDDARSALYGAIGNLYNMQDSLDLAMDWYAKAGAIFEKYGWNESNSILWYNIGETWVDAGEPKKAKPAYDKALQYAIAAGDSLMIAEAYKGYGNLYSYQGRAAKAMRYLKKANRYYASHRKEEAVARADNLEYMRESLSAQKKRLTLGLIAAAVLLALAVAVAVRLHRRRVLKMEAAPVPTADAPGLNDREQAILKLIAEGRTNVQIADEICLSPETIKWYRKRLLEKFDAANSAELISKAKGCGLL